MKSIEEKDISSISSEYIKETNNESYIISLILNEPLELSIQIITKDKFPQISYKKSFNLNELKELSKSFYIYDSIIDIYNCIKVILDERNYAILYKNENIIISIPIFLPSGKQNYINFNLLKEDVDKDKIIKSLCQKIDVLEKELVSVKQNKQNMDFILKSLLDRLEILEAKDRQREIKESKEIEEKEYSRLKDIKESSICNGNELSLFLSEFEMHKKFVGKNIRFKLIYKATQDGDKLSNFHNLCDYKDSVLVIIQSKNGARFGGYTEIGFNDKGPDIKDNNAFVFSLNKMKIYNSKLNENAIYCGKKLIGFKNTIYLYDNFLTKKNNANLGGYSNYPCDKNELNNNEEYFSCIEVEVFQIIGE